MSQILKNPPLIEAVFEMRWKHKSIGYKEIDPHYKLLVGQLYDKVKGEYEFYKELPTAKMPDEIAGYLPQHQFRKGEDEWPLIQIGPGILSVNDTKEYEWDDFEKRCLKTVEAFFELHPESKNVKIEGLTLRYIDGIHFRYDKENIFDFLKEKLHIELSLPRDNLKRCKINDKPLSFNSEFTYPIEEPSGAVHLRFATGKIKQKEAFIWETVVHSMREDVPQMPSEFKEWLRSAHEIAHKWFFGLLNDNFRERFE